ncbi:hypothetical protein DXG03_001475 [Asterophora parasitica]|uniref:Uncharacterized protein n=1 Tax=Asterophora parasitica TaxID=117018 RepID=A0A9P7GCK1_9AGAR|nr:hypothetical protein DXG03_001475 [Asterophora parasitica]
MSRQWIFSGSLYTLPRAIDHDLIQFEPTHGYADLFVLVEIPVSRVAPSAIPPKPTSSGNGVGVGDASEDTSKEVFEDEALDEETSEKSSAKNWWDTGDKVSPDQSFTTVDGGNTELEFIPHKIQSAWEPKRRETILRVKEESKDETSADKTLGHVRSQNENELNLFSGATLQSLMPTGLPSV